MDFGLKRFLLCLFASSLLLSCSAPIWQRVDVHRRSGNPEAAERELLAYLKLHPRDAKAWFLLAESRADLEKWPEMAEAFEKCERTNIDWRRDVFARKNHYWRKNFDDGIKLLESGEALAARTLFEACTIIFPARANGYRFLGEVSWNLGDTTAAINAFVRTLRIDPDEYYTRRFLMTLYFYTKQYDLAIHHAEYILGKNPQDIEALRTRAYSLGLKKDRDKANQAYITLTGPTGPQRFEDFEAWASYKYSLGLYDDAVRVLRQAMDYGADKVETLEAIMQAHLMDHNYVDLYHASDELLQIDSTHIKALQLKQISQLAMKQHEQATNTELTYLITVGTLRLALKDYGEVIKTTNEILQTDSLNIKAFELKIAALDSAGKFGEARANEIQMLHILSDKHFANQEYNKLLKTTSRILEINPIDVRAMEQKDSAHRALGDSAAAAQTRITYHLALAEMHKNEGNNSARLRDILNILLIDDHYLDALRMKWEAYEALGNRPEARRAKYIYLRSLAREQRYQKQFKELLITASSLLEMDNADSTASRWKREAHLALNQKEEAIQTQLQHFEVVASLYQQQGHHAELLKVVNEILLIQPENLYALELKYRALESLNNPIEAQVAKMHFLQIKSRMIAEEQKSDSLLYFADEIIKLDIKDLNGLRYRYLALRDLGRTAVADSAENIYLHTLAQSQKKREKWKELLTTSDKLVQSDNLDSTAVSLKEFAYTQLGDTEKATQTRLEYWHTLGTQYIQSKRYDDVIIVADDMLALKSDYIPALDLKKTAYYSKGDWEIASEIEQRMKELMTRK